MNKDYQSYVTGRKSLNDEGHVFPIQIMLDLETLGRDKGDVVLEAAAVAYNLRHTWDSKAEAPEVIGDYWALFNPHIQQKRHGMRVNLETIKWWNADPGRSLHFASLIEQGGKVDRLDIAVIDFVKFLIYHNVEQAEIWVRGNMDAPMLEGLIEKVTGWEAPWAYWQIRDLRTLHAETERMASLRAGVPLEITKIREYTPDHSAMADAYNQMLLHWELFKMQAAAWGI